MAQEESQHSTAGFIAVLLGATFLMGSSFIAGKLLLLAGVPAILLVGWRFFVAALATLPLVLLEGPLRRALIPAGLTLRQAFIIALIGLLQTAAVMGLLFLAMRSISASTAAILLFTNPLWVALFSRLFFGEALSASRLAGLVLGLAGVCLAIGIGPDFLAGGDVLAGELTGLASAFCWSAATLVNKRARLPIGSWALSFWQMLTGSLVLLALAMLLGQHWPAGTSLANWGWFFWLAVPASTGSFGLWFVALKKGGATRASSFLFAAPLFTVLLSFLVLGAPLTLPQSIGGVLIGLSLWLVNRKAPGLSARSRIAQAEAEGQP